MAILMTAPGITRVIPRYYPGYLGNTRVIPRYYSKYRDNTEIFEYRGIIEVFEYRGITQYPGNTVVLPGYWVLPG